MNKEKSTKILPMRSYLLVLPLALFLMSLSLPCSAQSNQKEYQIRPPAVNPQPGDTLGVELSYDRVPEYPGGEAQLVNFIQTHLKYPADAGEYPVEGRVVVKFIVQADGSIAKAGIVKSLDPACDVEALRVVNAMPKWTPGMKDGKPVEACCVLPLTFRFK